MKSVEELEALVETLTRERDLSLSAWESAGMQGRTAQSAMLKLTRQLEEAQERIELLTELREEERSLNAHFHHEIQAKHTAAEQAKRERDEARASWELCALHMHEARRERDEARAEVERLMHQLADQINETTHWQVMCKRETEEVERLTSGLQLEGVRLRLRLVDEVRSDAYRRGAEAMREACARVADAHCVPGTRDVIRALPIPEEP